MCCHWKCWYSEMRIYILVLRETALLDTDVLGHLFLREDLFCWCLHHHVHVKSLCSPSSSVRCSDLPCFIQFNFFPLQLSLPYPQCLFAHCHHIPWSIEPSLMICLKGGLQFLPTLPCSVSFPNMDLPCGHLLTHKLYPYTSFWTFLSCFSIQTFSEVFMLWELLPLPSFATSSDQPWFSPILSPLVFTVLASPPTSFSLLGSSSSAPTTVLLQELELLMTKPHFCSSCKVLFRKLCVNSHFCCWWEQCLEVSAGVKTEGWCWGA